MTASGLSERDAGILRSFARRIDPSDAGAHNNLGVLYYQKGLVDEAIAEFLHALELDSRMQVAQTNLAIAYRGGGYHERLVAALHERLRHRPDDGAARWELGRIHASLGRWAEAIQEFEMLLRLKPGDARTLIQLGLAEKGRGRLEAASARLARACEHDPDSPVALFYHGEALYNRGLNERALAELQRAVARNPDYAEAHYLLAFVYGDLGHHEEARRSSKRALGLNPALARAQTNLSLERAIVGEANTPAASGAPAPPLAAPDRATDAHLNLGLAFRQKGYFAEARREYELALEAGEDRQLALQATAEVHLLQGDPAAALERYTDLVRQYPQSPKLWNEQGVCFHQMGRHEEAGSAYRRAVAIDPNYTLAWSNLAVICAHGGDVDGTVDAFARALQQVTPPLAARLNLALFRFNRGEMQPSLEGYRSVLAVEPAHSVAWNGVGLVLMELRRYEDARNAFGRAVEADAVFAAAHYNLSFALSQLGDVDGALRETKRALELEPLYVRQKYSLAIELQHGNATIAVSPETSAEPGAAPLGPDFAVDPKLLDALFEQLTPPASAVTGGAGLDDPLALARDYIEKGLLELATAELNRARARGAERPRAAVLLGDIFARRGLHGEALDRYREARDVAPADRDALLGEVRALLALGRAAEAVALTDDLGRDDPNDVEALVARARVWLALGEPAEALDSVRAAQALAPDRADLFHLQARVATRVGDQTAALDAFRRALELDESLVQVWFDLGQLRERRGEWDEARAAYERTLDLLPTFVDAALALADLLFRLGAARGAVDVLATTLFTDPYELEALTALGRILLAQGRVDEALEAVDRVLRFDPDHPAALFHRGAVLADRRRFREAITSWERVVQLDPAGPFAVQARSRARSARELEHIFAAVG